MALNLQKSVKQPYRVVLSMDQALAEESDYSKYIQEGYQEDHLKFTEGEEPTRFRMRPLTNKMRCFIDAFPEGHAQKLAAIRCSLLSIENAGELPQPSMEFNQAIGADIIKMQWIEDHFSLPSAYINELAEHIAIVTDVTPFLSKA